MRTLRIVSIVMLLGACSELVSEDDPRAFSSYTEPGGCDGTSVICEWRSVNACGPDCSVKPTCVGVNQEVCAVIHDGNACDANSKCFWVGGVCRNYGGGSCELQQTMTACNQRTGECTWTNGCTGDGGYCFEQDTAAACTAIPGCGWQTP